MLMVYGRPDSSNAAKVFWLLDEIGQAYEMIPAGKGHGPVDTEAFLALNPTGKVPVLRDGETVVWESNAILRYLAARFCARTLWPDDAAARSQVDRWMDWASLSLAPPLTRLRKARSAGRTDDADLPAVRAAFSLLDGQLARRDFIAGPSLSLADVTAAPSVHRWVLLEGERPSLPNLEAYADRLRGFDGYVRHVRNALT